MSEMAIMDRDTGDTRITWDPDNPAEVENARQTFDRLVGEKKFMAYNVERGGERGEVIRTFDPTAEKLILAPPMVGG